MTTPFDFFECLFTFFGLHYAEQLCQWYIHQMLSGLDFCLIWTTSALHFQMRKRTNVIFSNFLITSGQHELKLNPGKCILFLSLGILYHLRKKAGSSEKPSNSWIWKAWDNCRIEICFSQSVLSFHSKQPKLPCMNCLKVTKMTSVRYRGVIFCHRRLKHKRDLMNSAILAYQASHQKLSLSFDTSTLLSEQC